MNVFLLTGAGDVERVEPGARVAEDGACAGGEAFDLGRTLAHVLVRLKEHNVDLGDEHARQSDRRADVDAYAQCVDLDLQRQPTKKYKQVNSKEK